MLSCTEEGMYVGVGGCMFWQTLPSISLYVWFLEGFNLYKYVFNETVLRDTSPIIGAD